MKLLLSIVFVCVMSSLPFSLVLAYGDDPLQVNMVPKKKILGGNVGGSKSPVTDECPLSVYYSQQSGQIELLNQSNSSVLFSYSIYDASGILLQDGDAIVCGNSVYILSLSCMADTPSCLEIEIGSVIYEGRLDVE